MLDREGVELKAILDREQPGGRADARPPRKEAGRA
jgi:hypothetical protein